MSALQKPLLGLRVMITRPIEQNDALAEQLQTLGAEVVVQPAIRIFTAGGLAAGR